MTNIGNIMPPKKELTITPSVVQASPIKQKNSENIETNSNSRAHTKLIQYLNDKAL